MPGYFHCGRFIKLADWTNPKVQYASPPGVHDEGVGILCGPASGNIIAVDIDTNDLGTQDIIFQILPRTPVIKTGKKGLTLFYHGRIASQQWRIGGKVVLEVLGEGRQTILPPSIYPETGEPYHWTGEKALWEIAPRDLPDIGRFH